MNEILETRFDQLLETLLSAGVEFILIGGLAAAAHGSARATFDVDVVYARTRENVRKLVAALEPLEPYLRGVPAGLPFKFDEATVRLGLNFTLQTRLGWLDLLGEVAGGGNFAQLLPFTEPMEIFGQSCRVVTLEKLIQLKRAAGRPKDLEPIAELQALLEERRKLG
jgi:hypothetical protein